MAWVGLSITALGVAGWPSIELWGQAPSWSALWAVPRRASVGVLGGLILAVIHTLDAVMAKGHLVREDRRVWRKCYKISGVIGVLAREVCVVGVILGYFELARVIGRYFETDRWFDLVGIATGLPMLSLFPLRLLQQFTGKHVSAMWLRDVFTYVQRGIYFVTLALGGVTSVVIAMLATRGVTLTSTVSPARIALLIAFVVLVLWRK